VQVHAFLAAEGFFVGLAAVPATVYLHTNVQLYLQSETNLFVQAPHSEVRV
jgi:hypothetical protein